MWSEWSVWWSPEKSQAFREAAGAGNLRLVESLSRDPEVELNWHTGDGTSPFICACGSGNADVVRYLLDFRDNRREIDFDMVSELCDSAILNVCHRGDEKLVEILLEDERVCADGGILAITPLWSASSQGHLGVVKRILASGREIGVSSKRMDHMTAAEVARQRGEARKSRFESEEEFQQKRKTFFDIAAIIEEFTRDPEGVRKQLRRELGSVRLAGELFALVVYLSDGYLTIRPENQDQRAQRFLSIATHLPADLQMVLCNRVFGLGDSIVKRDSSEKGFRKFAKGI